MYVCYGPCHKSGSPFPSKDFTTQTTLTWKIWNKEKLWLAALCPQLKGLHDESPIDKKFFKHFLSVWELLTSNSEMSAFWKDLGSWEANKHKCVSLLGLRYEAKWFIKSNWDKYWLSSMVQASEFLQGTISTFPPACEVTFHYSRRKYRGKIAFLATSNHRFPRPSQQVWPWKQYA